ncbi:hypothetical protein [Agathobaculum desmolans]|uniref:hypothetical protein n=1 Tax=Agathobaculum desmolans TaxID=39484 RepID=UPI002941C6F4|nr:hypothetical protein [Agathobaculum desmolans]
MSFTDIFSLPKWRGRCKLKAITILIVLFLFTMLAPITGLWQDSHRVISMDPVAMSAENRVPLMRDCQVEQLIHIQGTLTSLEIYIDMSPSQTETTDIEVTLTQNDVYENGILSVEPENASGYYSVPLDLRKFTAGTALLSIESRSSCEDPANVSGLYSSNQVGSGLSNMLWNGGECTSPLAFQYTVINPPSWFMYSFCMLVLLLVAICFTAYITSMKPDLLERHHYLLFLLSFLIIVLTISAREPTASFWGEPKSEAAYDFWYGQISNGTLKSLFTLEAGLYLSWLQRLIMAFAVIISPVKYVFAVTQVVSLCIIALFCSLFCLNTTSRYLGKTWSLMLSIFLGCSTLYNEYMFHSLGYWGILFIIWLFLSNLDFMKPAFYWGSMLLLVVLCFSKLFVVTWIPVALFCLLVLWKESSLRRKIFYIILAVLPLIHVTYIFIRTFSTIEQRQGVGSFQIPELHVLLENLFYYEIQAFNSLVLHVETPNALATNIFAGIVLLLIIGISVYFIFCKDMKLHYIGIFSVGCLILSVSAVGVCILGGLGNFDMRAPANWSTNVFGNNVHWIYIYTPLLFLAFAFIYLCKEKCRLVGSEGAQQIVNILLCCIVAPMALWYTASSETITTPSEYQVEWNKISYATENESYYFPVNINIPGAELISLQHNSAGKLFGFDANKNWQEIANGVGADNAIPYSRASIASVVNESIVNITVSRANTNYDCNYTVQLFDKEGALIEEVQQVTSDDRQWMTFIPEEPVAGVSEIGFVYSEAGTPAYVKGLLSVGYVAMGVHS